MTRKQKITISSQQKLEYAKLMVEVNYTYKQIQDMSGACSSAVARWKKQYSCHTPIEKHYYPNSGHEHKYAPNLLKRNFYPATNNTHWVGDITYNNNTHQGWSYLACFLDLSTK